jgi:ABC-type transporter Mla MlaB component
MGATFNKSGNAGTITLNGELTLPYAEELKHVIIKAVLDVDDLSFAFADVEAADLSLLQLLCSAHRSAVRLHKKVGFSGALPKPFTDTVEAAGFSRLKGCKLDCEKSCLWMSIAGA